MIDIINRLKSLRVILGIDSPETRGWAPVVQREARRTITAAIDALTARGIVSGAAGETAGLDPKGKSPVATATRPAPNATDRPVQAAQTAAQEGWQLVPVEPTRAMLDAIDELDPESALVTYALLLAAAPLPTPKDAP
jgi:hypothetical protein